MPDPASPREQESIHAKKQEFVRREIWTAAMDLFFSAGFDETTIDHIAVQANISRRTFFRYFSSKEDVMAATMKGYGAALVQALRDQPVELAPLDAIRSVVKRVARLAADTPYASRTAAIARRSPAARSAQLLELPVIEDELCKVFASRVEGRTQELLNVRLLASVTVSVTNMTIYTWLQNPEDQIENVVDRAFSALVQLCCG